MFIDIEFQNESKIDFVKNLFDCHEPAWHLSLKLALHFRVKIVKFCI